MGRKYIIELEDEPFGKNDDPRIPRGMIELWRVKGFNSLVFDDNGLKKLKPLEDALDNAYAHGHSDAECDYRDLMTKKTEESYSNGIEKMHEAVKKLYSYECSDTWVEMGFKCFEDDWWDNFRWIMTNCSAKEIVSKIEAYEERKKNENAEIKVGSEVITIISKQRGTVLDIYDDGTVKILLSNVIGIIKRAIDGVKATGRFSPEIADFMKNLKKEALKGINTEETA